MSAKKTISNSQEPVDTAALLRLKRFETPSPDYFERSIDDFHRRQTTALLRRPIWRIALDRFAAELHRLLPLPAPVVAARFARNSFAAAGVCTLCLLTLNLKPWEPGLSERAGSLARAILPTNETKNAPSELALASNSEGLNGAAGLSGTNLLALTPEWERHFGSTAPAPEFETTLASVGGSIIRSPAKNFSPTPSVRILNPPPQKPRYVLDSRPAAQGVALRF